MYASPGRSDPGPEIDNVLSNADGLGVEGRIRVIGDKHITEEKVKISFARTDGRQGIMTAYHRRLSSR